MSINDERARILRLVASGDISPAEAEDLLSALEPSRQAESRPLNPSGNLVPPMAPIPPMPPALPRRGNRSLVIHITEGDDTKVNVRIPLGLARAAGKFVPRRAQQYLDNYEINLDQLLESLTTMEGSDTLVEITDGDDQIRIAVE